MLRPRRGRRPASTRPTGPGPPDPARDRTAGRHLPGRRRRARHPPRSRLHRSGGTKARDLEAQARALAGLKAYMTNLTVCPDGSPVSAQFVIGAGHRLLHIEKSFRMSKHDLQVPIYHGKRDSIEAHLTIVSAALAITRWIETTTRLVDPQVRPHRPSLPHHPDPGRRPDPHRRPTPSPTIYEKHSA